MAFEGLKISTGNAFSSIEGLSLWLDSRQGVFLDGSDRVETWIGRTDNFYTFNRATSLRPYYTNNLIDSDSITSGLTFMGMTRPSDASFNFLHDGSPFGLYVIYGGNEAGASGSSTIFNEGNGAGSTRAELVIGWGASVHNFTFRTYNAGAFDEFLVFGSNTANQQINSLAIIRDSAAGVGNLTTYVNNIASLTKTFSNSLLGSPVGSSALFSTANNLDARVLGATILAYDWSGKTPTEVAALDSQVRTLLESEKLQFTYPV